jgi:hypothetical protein
MRERMRSALFFHDTTRGVAIMPGTTALQVTPAGASSAASVCTMPISPALVAL